MVRREFLLSAVGTAGVFCAGSFCGESFASTSAIDACLARLSDGCIGPVVAVTHFGTDPNHRLLERLGRALPSASFVSHARTAPTSWNIVLIDGTRGSVILRFAPKEFFAAAYRGRQMNSESLLWKS